MRKLSWLTLTFILGMMVLFIGSASADLVIDQSYQLISKTRVGRTAYEYTYQVTIFNNGSDVQNVTASVTSSSTYTIITDGDISFGDVAGGSTVTSTDTFSFQQNRTYAFDPSALSWDIQYETAPSPLRITDVTPDAALPGNTVTIQASGKIDSLPMYVIFFGRDILSAPVAGKPDDVTFQVPDGANSGPLYVKQGDRESNSMWFSITEASLTTPSTENTIIDNDSKPIASNLLLVAFIKEFSSIEEAQRIAASHGGEVVGQIPSMQIYQIKVPGTTLDQLRNIKKLIESDISVDFVMIDFILNEKAADWSDDPDQPNQRASNKVEEGAKLYTERVSPSDSSKIHPVFTSIGIIEDGVDYQAADFDNYGEDGTARSNNIAIYASDIDGSTTDEEHGTTVTGMIAAELGDGNDERGTGNNAGLLQGLENSHGGFNIAVKTASAGLGSYWSRTLLATYNIIESGASVINWSLGINLKDAPTRDGGKIDCSSIACIAKELFDENTEDIKQFIEKKIEANYPRVVIVGASGNETSFASYMTPTNVETDSLIVVGAHDNTSNLTDFSNIGSKVDITASGVVTKSNGNVLKEIDGEIYIVNIGTSFAAPLVTATVAAMQSINPDLTASDVRGLLRKSALPLDPDVAIDATLTEVDGVATRKLSKADGEVRDDGKCFYATDKECEGKSAILNVEGAIQAAIDSLGSKTVPEGDPIDVTLPFGSGDVTKNIDVTVPEGLVFDKVDILFLVDVSGSYGDDIGQFKAKAVDLTNAFISAGRNVQIGVATFSDFPISPYGSNGSGDYAYHLNQPLTSSQDTAIASINGISLHYGMDSPESQLEALYQAATGAGRTVSGYPYANIPSSSVGWRTGALPIIFLATDARFHNSDSETSYPGEGWTQTVTELTDRKIQVYGLQSGGTITDVVNIVNETGGEHFTLSRNSSEIVDAVFAALTGASSKVDIKLVPNGDFADLIQSIKTDTGEDGSTVGYIDVAAGETKSFDVVFSRHFWKGDETADHVFAFRLLVEAEDVAIIEEIPVTVHVKFR